MRSVADPETEFRIVPLETPPSVDGLAMTEPKWLECDECGARVPIDLADETQTTIDNLPHDKQCPQRDVVWHYFERQYVDC